MLRKLLYKLEKADFKKIVLVFPFIACLHELEEWNILPWHRKYNTNVPDIVTDTDLHIAFILISILFFLWVLISLVPRNKRATAYILFPLMAIGLVNGIEHLIWLFEFGVYPPGFLFGSLLEIPLAIYIIFRILKENLVAKWYSIAFGILALLGSVKLLLLGKELDPVIRGAMLLAKGIADYMGGYIK